MFVVACYMALHPAVCRLISQSTFFVSLLSLALLLLLKYSGDPARPLPTGPHPHVTGVAVYPAFFFSFLFYLRHVVTFLASSQRDSKNEYRQKGRYPVVIQRLLIYYLILTHHQSNVTKNKTIHGTKTRPDAWQPKCRWAGAMMKTNLRV